MMMKTTLFAAALALWCTAATAQPTAREELRANKFLAGGNYVDYDRQYNADAPTVRQLTKAPKGYKPYYMSHYGRHGSRWLIGRDDYMRVIRPMRKARQQNKLTREGEETLRRLELFNKTTHNRLGDLSTVGERQHHGIGRRLTQNFPEIFKKRGVTVDARSTVVNRCILSMVAECEELMAANPTMRIHNDVSDSLQFYLNQPWDGLVKKYGGSARAERDAFHAKHTHPERLCQQLFNDQQWAADSIEAGRFMRHLFEIAINMQSHDVDIDLLHLFNDDEIYDQWRLRNADWYVDYGPSPLSGGIMPFSQRNLLRNIIETADTTTLTQATMRFGHEVCVMPLACLMELDSCGVAVEKLDDVEYHWRNYRIFPMACNIQLIFYKPKKQKTPNVDDVLVKALLNEREVSLPVATDQFPYYRWKDVRRYWLNKLDSYTAREQRELK